MEMGNVTIEFTDRCFFFVCLLCLFGFVFSFSHIRRRETKKDFLGGGG
jgi:hypothetical protein